jgi:hypothetical protein
MEADNPLCCQAKLTKRLLREPESYVVAYHHCRAGDPRLCRPNDLLLNLAFQLAEALPAMKAKLEMVVKENKVRLTSLWRRKFSSRFQQ